jgi:peptidoglycan hydrolase-like protein with peptidoglycan-binding domain
MSARKWRPRPLDGWQRLARLRLQPERVQEIQQALIREGYLREDANGQWDSQTHDAMLHYQTDHGFPATGLPEAKSLMKLGLGSHPLPPELDHGPAAGANPNSAPGAFTVTPSLPSVSQAAPPSQ